MWPFCSVHVCNILRWIVYLLYVWYLYYIMNCLISLLFFSHRKPQSLLLWSLKPWLYGTQHVWLIYVWCRKRRHILTYKPLVSLKCLINSASHNINHYYCIFLVITLYEVWVCFGINSTLIVLEILLRTTHATGINTHPNMS